VPNKNSTDGDVVTLINTVQYIISVLRTGETKDERFAHVMKAFYGIVVSK
jgi:hypothetical protein